MRTETRGGRTNTLQRDIMTIETDAVPTVDHNVAFGSLIRSGIRLRMGTGFLCPMESIQWKFILWKRTIRQRVSRRLVLGGIVRLVDDSSLSHIRFIHSYHR